MENPQNPHVQAPLIMSTRYACLSQASCLLAMGSRHGRAQIRTRTDWAAQKEGNEGKNTPSLQALENVLGHHKKTLETDAVNVLKQPMVAIGVLKKVAASKSKNQQGNVSDEIRIDFGAK